MALADIPGYGAYIERKRQNEQQPLAELQQATGAIGLLAKMQEQQDAATLRTRLTESGGDVEKALAAAISSGNIKAAHELAPLVKLEQERKQREQTPAMLAEINRQFASPSAGPQELGIGQPVGVAGEPSAPVSAGDVRQRRIAHLTALSQLPQYANNAIASQRIQAEIDKLSEPKAMPARKRISGEVEIQEEMQPDGTWKEVGRGPRFARQVAPTVSINAPSKEDLSPEAVRDLAIQSLYDPNALSGYRRDTTAMSRIANERLKVMKESGVTSQDVVSGRAGFKADQMSLNKMVPQYDAITAFEQTAIRNGKVLMQLADKVDTTGTPVIERWIRAGRKEVAGDTDVAKFNAQMYLYRAEAARILTQPNLSGVLSDSARKEVEEFLKGNASANQVRGVVNLLESDFGRRKQTFEEQISSIRARMRGRVAPGGETPLPAAPTAPAVPTAPAGGDGWSIKPVNG